ncbi:GNAT family N-acetyltransferase [Streptomyces sp. NPDC060048]|uniref:GNAT family N-acetyltransferase n=1 Tax=unclassified Streptomyces TaxID=2593676 RepID=UPI00368F9760
MTATDPAVRAPQGRPPVAPRAASARRLRMMLGYHWRNSGSAPLNRLHNWWDGRPGARTPSVVSTAGGLSIAYSGLPAGLAYTLEFTEERRTLATPGQAVRTTVPRSSRLLGGAGAVPPPADIEIVGSTAERARRLPQDAALVIPMRVHFVVDTHRPADEVLRSISRREREQHARCRRERQWTWEQASAPALFDEFYDRMYRPTMFNRHGLRERVESKAAAFECIFRRGFLFILSEGGERIAGAMCHWDPGTKVLTLRLLGVADGAAEHYDSGAFKALYHHLLAWAAGNGVRHVDFQGTEPFLSKGTFQWKRRFGSRVVLPPNHFGGKRLWLKVHRDTPQVRDFLAANPVLAEAADGALHAVYFQDADRPARLDLSGKAPGIRQSRVVAMDDFLARLPRAGGLGAGHDTSGPEPLKGASHD